MSHKRAYPLKSGPIQRILPISLNGNRRLVRGKNINEYFCDDGLIHSREIEVNQKIKKDHLNYRKLPSNHINLKLSFHLTILLCKALSKVFCRG